MISSEKKLSVGCTKFERLAPPSEPYRLVVVPTGSSTKVMTSAE